MSPGRRAMGPTGSDLSPTLGQDARRQRFAAAAAADQGFWISGRRRAGSAIVTVVAVVPGRAWRWAGRPSAHRPREDHGAPLLVLVEAGIERLRRVGELAQGLAAGGRGIRHRPQGAGGVVGEPGPVAHRLAPLLAQLGHVADRGFHRRPQLLLVGVELQAGMQGGDAGIREGGPVLGAQRAPATVPAEALGTVVARGGGAGQPQAEGTGDQEGGSQTSGHGYLRLTRGAPRRVHGSQRAPGRPSGAGRVSRLCM